MKRLTSFLLILSLLITVLSFSSAAMAEENGTDYSWLDDMTINQLKELDKEIHKRIPYGGQEAEKETVSLPGTWYMNVFGIECYVVLHEDGTCVLVSSNGNICRGNYTVTGTTVMISSEYMHALAGTWEISGKQLVNSMLQVAAVKTDKPVRYASSMGGSSMNDILEDGDALLVEYREPSDLKRFDLVLVNYPGRENTLFTKRLIGLPGDTVELRDGYLFLNDEMYIEPYINVDYRFGRLNSFDPYTVPEEAYFVLGDHRNNSNDSRSVGPLSADMILGVVVEINGVPYSTPE